MFVFYRIQSIKRLTPLQINSYVYLNGANKYMIMNYFTCTTFRTGEVVPFELMLEVGTHIRNNKATR
jgi:hypothetical protein